jgi:tRNA threonylcarbamoyladenosine biosynthesis protein TsaB
VGILLHIETSGKACSVALSKNGSLLAMKEDQEGRSHARVLGDYVQTVLIESGLALKDVSAVSISSGPGSYTGLRIGFSFAKGLCFGLSIPLITVNTLDTLAWRIKQEESSNITDTDLIIPMIDARRMEVYTCTYSASLKQLADYTSYIVDENNLPFTYNNVSLYIGGDGAEKCYNFLANNQLKYNNNISFSAYNQIELATILWKENNYVDTAYAEPFYLKDFKNTH